MTDNPLLQARALGQSIWLDDIHRGLLDSGDFAHLVNDDGVAGVTSNPAILEKAITSHADYDQAIAQLRSEGRNPQQIYEALALADLGRAADLLAPCHHGSDGQDGMVSLEVSPLIADDTETTLSEARRLWQALDRPNAMIKVPATLAGLPAIRQLTAEGININATLLFARERYNAVRDAFNAGLAERLDAGQPLAGITSVASFFISRIDTLADRLLDAVQPGSPLRGETACALARLCYDDWRASLKSPAWQRLAAAGAHPQRLLWASTSTKDPAYPDVKYVESLMGPHTVNTLPLKTLTAFRDHGRVVDRLSGDNSPAQRVIDQLGQTGIDLVAIGQQLEREGVDKFIAAYQRLLDALAAKAAT